MNDQKAPTSTLATQARKARKIIHGIIPGSRIRHLERVEDPNTLQLLRHPSNRTLRSVWFVLAHAKPHQTFGLLVSLYEENTWAVHADSQFPYIGKRAQTLERIHECLLLLKQAAAVAEGKPLYSSEGSEPESKTNNGTP